MDTMYFLYVGPFSLYFLIVYCYCIHSTFFQITPIHCAAINPNVKYLQKLLSVVPEYTIMDQKQRRPIHYAAACEGTAPLDFLLKR